MRPLETTEAAIPSNIPASLNALADDWEYVCRYWKACRQQRPSSHR